jgi:RimJ/RimL family protein N-acetyltransferase
MNIKTNNFNIREIEERDINKNFINSLNNKKLNQFLSTGKKKQKKKDALNYFNCRKKNKDIYLIVFNKKRLVGTITYKKYQKSSLFLGYTVLNQSYIGNDLFFKAVKLSIRYILKKFHVKKILAGTNKNNIASSFFLLKLGFVIEGRTKKFFRFIFSNSKL